MIIPQEYTIQKFHQLAGYAKPKHNGSIIEGGCPICKEGKSWGRKRRLYYMIKEDYIFCHNCGWSGKPVKFIQELEGISYKEILHEARDYDILPEDITKPVNIPYVSHQSGTLPEDSINLYDESQLSYYKDNDIVTEVYKFAKKRGLLTATNKPSSLWVSLKDFIHKNRLILPFYDDSNTIQFYQTRTVFPTERLPKYLSRSGSEKTLFNVNRIDPDIDNIFIFEGPIDACFCSNGVAVAGIQDNSSTSMNSKQSTQLKKYPLHSKTWVLDSQWLDKTSMNKSISLAEQGHNVFVWPEEYGTRFKDFNDMAIGLGVNEIPYKFILDNSHTGLKVRVMLGQVR